MKVFCDLDGVLVDFHQGVIDAFKISLDRLNALSKPWPWTWVIQESHVPEKEFWAALNERFWTELPWTKEGKEVLALVEQRFGKENICLLTSPTWNPGSVVGKINWIRRELPAYRYQNLIGSAKYFCAGLGNLLIDDSEDNCAKFHAHGGISFLYPRPWNRNWHMNPLDTLRKYIDGKP